MKKKIRIEIVIMLIFTIILSGCSVKDFIKGNNQSGKEENDNSNNDKKMEIGEVTDDTVAVIVNKYNDVTLKKYNSVTTIRLDDTEERFLIIPMKDNIDIEIWSVQFKDDKFTEKELKEEFKDINKTHVIEVHAIRPESVANYMIKIKSDVGVSEYYISHNGANGNDDIEYMIATLDNSKEESKDDNNGEEDNEAVLDLGLFIPNGDIEIKYEGSDFVPEVLYVKGNGTTYQIVGTNGKGPFVKVYTNYEDKLSLVYTGDLTEEEIANVSNINYLDKKGEGSKDTILDNPIKVGTEWDNKEIVEVGENLKIGDLTLEGSYVKTWEKVKDGDNETVTVYYYSEGIGCVQYRVIVNGEIVEWAKALEVIK